MSEEVLVTVGVAVYNGENFLRQALESVLNQTYRHLEVLVFNDGSTDASLSIVRSFADERIVVIDSSRNYGPGYGRQVLKTLASGDYLTWLDADDVYLPGRIEKLLHHALRQGSDITCDVYRMMSHSGELLEATYRIPDKVAGDPHFTRLFERNVMIPHPLIHRRCYQAIDYDVTLRCSEDYDYWLKCSYAGYSFSLLDEIGLLYRLTEQSLSSDHERNRFKTRQVLEKYRVEELVQLYRTRGYSESTANYMACLQHIFRYDYEAALAYALRPWCQDNDVDQDFYIGTLYLRVGNPQQARYHLEKHLARNPRSPAGHNNLGVARVMMNEDGHPHFAEALACFPGYCDAGLNLKDPSARRITDTQLNAYAAR